MPRPLADTDLVWVTGAGGAIGGAVVDRLLAEGRPVAALGNGLSDWATTPHRAAVPVVDGCVGTEAFEALAARTGLPAAIIHLAGGAQVGPSFADPLRDFQRTVETTVALLQWMHRHASDAALVYASSAAVYGSACTGPIAETLPHAPISPYGFHKAMAEDAIRFWSAQFGLRAAILRPFSVYGPSLRKQLIFELNNRLAVGAQTLSLGGSGEELRDWLWMDDAAAMLIDAAALADAPAPVFNAGTGTGTSLRRICELVIAAHGEPVGLEFSGVVPPGDPVSLVADMRRGEAAGLKAAVGPEEGIARTIAGYRARMQGSAG